MSTDKNEEPVIIGVDMGKVGGDFTGYACSCGQVRVSTDGPCEKANCPIPAFVGTTK